MGEARDEFVLVLKTEEPDLTLPNKLVDLIPLPPNIPRKLARSISVRTPPLVPDHTSLLIGKAKSQLPSKFMKITMVTDQR